MNQSTNSNNNTNNTTITTKRLYHPDDKTSFSNPNEICIQHIDWDYTINFTNQIVYSIATYTVHIHKNDSNVDNHNASKPFVLIFDTSNLVIHSIQEEQNNETKTKEWVDVSYTLDIFLPTKEHLGQQLTIQLLPSDDTDDEANIRTIRITYETIKDKCTAVQWLQPEQTAGKVYPYMFTQCFAIHARSLLPCQDRPSVKFTYTATVHVPHWSTAVMSAVRNTSNNNSTKTSTTTSSSLSLLPPEEQQQQSTTVPYHIFYFEQNVPMSSYLLAIACGQLECRNISHRCAVYTEPCQIDAVEYEFQLVEQYVQIIEAITAMSYPWNRYDILCLPPSFPYGGAENPCMTFVTPTLLTGDRSLADVVVHEIAHSWTGNLITCTTWDDFWLNEGWTMWLQRKGMIDVTQNELFYDFDALSGYQELQDAVASMSNECTKLVLSIEDNDPDTFYSRVAYEKGFYFVTYLERLIGSSYFLQFVHSYIRYFGSKGTVTSTEFKSFFIDTVSFYSNEMENRLKTIDWDKWYYGTGMPHIKIEYDTTLATASEALATIWIQYDRSQRDDTITETSIPSENTITKWTTNQIICFLDKIIAETISSNTPLLSSTIESMDNIYLFLQSTNAEILYRFGRLCIGAEYDASIPVIITFITSQGRMKFVRPLYRALYQSIIGRTIAIETFQKYQSTYHPICSKMIATDLNLTTTTSTTSK